MYFYTDVLIGSGICTCGGQNPSRALLTYKRNERSHFWNHDKKQINISCKAVSVHAKTKFSQRTLGTCYYAVETFWRQQTQAAFCSYTLYTSTQFHDTPLPCHHVTRNDVTPPESLAGVTKTKIHAGK
jgi:hypothetical protein